MYTYAFFKKKKKEQNQKGKKNSCI